MPKNNETKLLIRKGDDDHKYTMQDDVHDDTFCHEYGDLNHYFELPNPGLRSYFDRVKLGQPEEYRTPFYKGKSVAQILDEWMPHLDVLAKEWPTLLEFENDLSSKVGPMSIMKPLDERREDIESYFNLIHENRISISKRAEDLTIKEYSPIRGLRLRGQEATVDKMKKSTNSGSPYFQKRKLVVDKTVPSFCYWMQKTVSNGLSIPFNVLQFLPNTDHAWGACAVLGWRGQEGGPTDDDVKQRVVWMFPFAVNVSELQCYQPLIEACQKAHLVPAWESMELVDDRITRLFDTKHPDDLVVCTDFTKFDQHFNDVCQVSAHNLLQRILTDDKESKKWLERVFWIKYRIPLAVQFDELYAGEHGMASGSGGTNADETLVHRTLQHEAALAHNQVLNPNSQCLGDDGILSYPGITVEDVTNVYRSHGLEMNESKQYASAQDCVYLRRWHHRDYRENGVCVGVYSTARALGRLAEQERYYDPEKWSKEMVALRQLSILENVKYHPLKEEFVQFCMKGDKYRLGLDIPGFLENVDRLAQEATDDMPDFLGYTKSMMKGADRGLSSWWIVKYLKSLA